jgi:hypothetical protein
MRDEIRYKDGRQVHPPLKPNGVDISLAVDLSAMRPDEFFRQRKMPWMRSVLDRAAWDDAMDAVASGSGRLR